VLLQGVLLVSWVEKAAPRGMNIQLRRSRGEGLGVDGDDGVGLSAAGLFAILWNSMADTLGSAAVSAIVRRAVRCAAAENPELVDLVILREDLAYRYRLPKAWAEQDRRDVIAFRALAAEIGRLLVELTGTVVICRLEQIPELRAAGLVWRTEETK
jgi:hypothetical protein